MIEEKETFEEDLDLCRRVSSGDIEAKEELYSKYYKLVWLVVLRYCKKVQLYPGGVVEPDDLFQEAIIYTFARAERYDGRIPLRNWITGFLHHEIATVFDQQRYAVRVPISVAAELGRIQSLNDSRRSREVGLMNSMDIRETLGVSAKKVPYLRRAPLLRTHIGSLEGSFASHEDHSLGNAYLVDRTRGAESVTMETPASPEDAVLQGVVTEAVRQLLDTLTEREAGVIAMRFGLDDGESKTLDEVACVYGGTRERIRRIEGKAMSKLCHPSRSGRLSPQC